MPSILQSRHRYFASCGKVLFSLISLFFSPSPVFRMHLIFSQYSGIHHFAARISYPILLFDIILRNPLDLTPTRVSLSKSALYLMRLHFEPLWDLDVENFEANIIPRLEHQYDFSTFFRGISSFHLSVYTVHVLIESGLLYSPACC